jgi:hypothetical protein
MTGLTQYLLLVVLTRCLRIPEAAEEIQSRIAIVWKVFLFCTFNNAKDMDAALFRTGDGSEATHQASNS